MYGDTGSNAACSVSADSKFVRSQNSEFPVSQLSLDCHYYVFWHIISKFTFGFFFIRI